MRRGRTLRIILLIALVAFFLSPAYADTLVLPASLSSVSEEAFSMCDSVDVLVLPEGVRAIGDRAFFGCSNLAKVVLPESLEAIGGDAFANCPASMLFVCPTGSPAEAWARQSGFDWSAGTVCRALVIGQDYAGTDAALYGPPNDRTAMVNCLKHLDEMDYLVEEKINLTGNGILEAIGSTFSGATEQDISLFYYSGHGNSSGSLIGSDYRPVTPARLRAALDQIPGRKVVIVDTCHAGYLLDTEPLKEKSRVGDIQSPDAFVQSFLGAFSLRSRGTPPGGAYYMMVSCQAWEDSVEGYIGAGERGKTMGLFTYALCKGLGWDGVADAVTDRAADKNADRVVSFKEAFVYARDLAAEWNVEQNAGIQPQTAASDAFSPFR
ncbi:MAG: caspase family protein [Clostridia bacterium]|nr:caspase family protein [Clostridia bacterium]